METELIDLVSLYSFGSWFHLPLNFILWSVDVIVRSAPRKQRKEFFGRK